MLPLFAYLALSLSSTTVPQLVVPEPKPHALVDLRYNRPPATHVSHRGSQLSAEALHESSGIIDLKEAAFGVLDRSAPSLARYARGPVVVLPLFAPTVERDTAYGAAVSLRMP